MTYYFAILLLQKMTLLNYTLYRLSDPAFVSYISIIRNFIRNKFTHTVKYEELVQIIIVIIQAKSINIILNHYSLTVFSKGN